MVNIIFLGPPGAGKGTQSKKACQAFGLAHLSTGKLVRDEIRNDTELGHKATQYLSEGMLLEDDIIIEMVKKAIVGKKDILFDGFPRTLAQDELLRKIITIDMAIEFEVSPDVLINRIKSRRMVLWHGKDHSFFDEKHALEFIESHGGQMYIRHDDTPQAALKRIEGYNDITKPITERYESEGKLLKINGDQPIEKVWQEMRMHLTKLISMKS